jgi:transposase
MNAVVRIGIDLAKDVFHVYAVDRHDHMVFSRNVTRRQLRELLATLLPCMVATESCGTAHHWARYARQFGHETRIVASHYVTPYRKGNKHDAADAEAICEAAARPNMRFVPAKDIEQQDVQWLHRVRQRRMEERTALINQIRGLLLEFGVPVRLGPGGLRRAIPVILNDARHELSDRGRRLIAELYNEWMALEQWIAAVDREIQNVFRSSAACQRLAKIGGIGPLTSTALVAAVGDATEFRNGRHLAAWLGLVPRQHSSGGQQRLLGISKRGDCYLRSLFIHGARALLKVAGRRSDPIAGWATNVAARRGFNVATVAIANKNARIAWAMLARGEPFRSMGQ